MCQHFSKLLTKVIAEFYYVIWLSDSLIQLPFEHESLLIDQKEELDDSEKEMAMRGVRVYFAHVVKYLVTARVWKGKNGQQSEIQDSHTP